MGLVPEGVAEAFGNEAWFFIWVGLLVIVIITQILNYPRQQAQNRRDEVEGALPDFLNGLAENVRAGMSVEAAIDGLAKQRDDRMGHLLKRMVATMHSDSFAKAMEQLSTEADSKMVSRVISILNIALVSAGSFSDVLERLGAEFFEVYLLKQECIAKTSSQANFILMGGSIICPAIMGIIVATIGSGSVGSHSLDMNKPSVVFGMNIGMMDLLLGSMKIFMLFLGAAAVLMNAIIMQTLRVAPLRIPLFQFIALTVLIGTLQFQM